MLEALDKFEGTPQLYKRSLELVKPANGQAEPLSAWIYVFHSFHEKLLQETLHDNYICNNYDVLRSLSGKLSQEERATFYKELRRQCSEQ